MYTINIVLREIYICALMDGMTIQQDGNKMVFLSGNKQCLKVRFEDHIPNIIGQRCIVGLDLSPIFAAGVAKPVDFTSVWSEEWEEII